MNNYKIGQHIKVRVTGIQPYGAFVETPNHTEGLIHISEIMDDYVHNLKKFLSEGQIVKAKILSIDDEGKLNLSLKDNDYFKNYERKKEKQSVLDEIRETERTLTNLDKTVKASNSKRLKEQINRTENHTKGLK